MPNSLLAAKCLEGLMEHPFDRILNWLVEQSRQEGNDRQTETNGTPGPDRLVLDVLHRAPAVPHHAVNRKRRQSHTGHALEDEALQHHGPVVLQRRDFAGRRLVVFHLLGAVFIDQAEDALLARCQLDVGVQHPPVVPVCLVSFVADVAQDVRPRDAIGTTNEPGVRNGAEGLPNVGGVGDVAVGGEENSAEAGGIGGVTDVGLGRGRHAVVEYMTNVSSVRLLDLNSFLFFFSFVWWFSGAKTRTSPRIDHHKILPCQSCRLTSGDRRGAFFARAASGG